MSYEKYQASLAELCEYLKKSLEVLTETSGATLFALSEKLKKLDGSFIQTFLKNKENLKLLVQKFCSKDKGFVFADEKLSATEEKQAATITHDGSKALTMDELLKMTDLDFLFSLNAYDFPYCESTNNRSVYEGFFSWLIQEVVPHCKDSNNDAQSYRYRLLEQSIPQLRVVTESWFNVINCLVELFKLISIRCNSINTISASGRGVGTVMDELVVWFSKPNETEFKKINMRKLVETLGGVESESNNSKEFYSSKIESFVDSILTTIEVDIGNSDVLTGLKNNCNATEETRVFCEESLSFINKYKELSGLLNDNEGSFQVALTEGRALLDAAAAVEVVIKTRCRSHSSVGVQPGGDNIASLQESPSPTGRKLALRKSASGVLPRTRQRKNPGDTTNLPRRKSGSGDELNGFFSSGGNSTSGSHASASSPQSGSRGFFRK